MREKTPMGLQQFKFGFFFRRKFTKIDLALEVVIKNPSKVVWRLFVMFSSMWHMIFFIFKSPMETPLGWKNLLRLKKLRFHIRSKLNNCPKNYRSKLDRRYLRRMCFSSRSFLTQITNPMGLEGFIWLESLFVGQKKVASNRLRFQQQVAWM